MNRMANGVIREMDDAMKKEDDMILKYEKQREMKLRRDEDKKEKQKLIQKLDMVRTLTS